MDSQFDHIYWKAALLIDRAAALLQEMDALDHLAIDVEIKKGEYIEDGLREFLKPHIRRDPKDEECPRAGFLRWNSNSPITVDATNATCALFDECTIHFTGSDWCDPEDADDWEGEVTVEYRIERLYWVGGNRRIIEVSITDSR